MLTQYENTTTWHNLFFALYLTKLQEYEATKHQILSATKKSVVI